MIIYADVLLTLNLVVNYFLILASQKLLRLNVKWYRSVLGATLGSVASLYIFLPQSHVFFETLFKISLCCVMTLIVFGFKTIKLYVKSVMVLFIVTCAYAGIMFVYWQLFKPDGMAVNNSVVYFNISPLMMVAISLVIYILFLVCNKIFTGIATNAQECEISVIFGKKSVKYKAIIDTGNSICDLFGNSEILIVDREIILKLFGKNYKENYSRYRVIPFKTVSGEDLLEGYRCDSSVVKSKNATITLEKPILASSKIPLKEGFSGIVNPKIFN